MLRAVQIDEKDTSFGSVLVRVRCNELSAVQSRGEHERDLVHPLDDRPRFRLQLAIVRRKEVGKVAIEIELDSVFSGAFIKLF